MNDTTFTIRLFGSLRRFGPTVDVTAPQGSPALALKRCLAERLIGLTGDRGVLALVAFAALACDCEVLHDSAVPPADARLAILPPVSGW